MKIKETKPQKENRLALALADADIALDKARKTGNEPLISIAFNHYKKIKHQWEKVRIKCQELQRD